MTRCGRAQCRWASASPSAAGVCVAVGFLGALSIHCPCDLIEMSEVEML